MANKTTANAFMSSAQKSKREMADIQKGGSDKRETDEVELLLPLKVRLVLFFKPYFCTHLSPVFRMYYFTIMNITQIIEIWFLCVLFNLP